MFPKLYLQLEDLIFTGMAALAALLVLLALSFMFRKLFDIPREEFDAPERVLGWIYAPFIFLLKYFRVHKR